MVAALVIPCLALAAIPAVLPGLIESLIVPRLAASLDMPQFRVDVRRADLSGLDLSEVSFGPETGIAIDAVLADWSFRGLLQGRLDKVRVLGLRVLARETEGGWEIPGLPVMKNPEGGDARPMSFPGIDEIHVDGTISVEGRSVALETPISVNGSLDDDGGLTLDALAKPAGQDLRASLQGNLTNKDFRLTCALRPASLAALASLVPALRNLPVSGTMAALAEAALPHEGQAGGKVGLTFDTLRTAVGESVLGLEGNASMRLSWENGADIAIDPIRLDAPWPLTLTVGDIRADLENGVFGCAWELALPPLPGLEFSSPPRLRGGTEAVRGADGWDVRSQAELDPFDASPAGMPELKAVMDPSSMTVDLVTSPSGTRLAASLAPGSLRLSHKKDRATLSGLAVSCNATVAAGSVDGEIDFSGARLEASRPGQSLSVPRLDGRFTFGLGDRPNLSGSLGLSARARAGDASGTISLRLPLAWPEPAASAGSAQLNVSWSGQEVAKISSRLVQNVHGISIDGTAALTPVNVRARIRGQFDPRRAESSWVEVGAAQNVTLPGGLARFAPALGDLTGTARLDAAARLDMSRGVPSLPATLKLSGISLTHAGTKISLSGGNAGLEIPDLLAFRSAPDQRVTFERLRLGDLTLDKGDIRYQIEAPHSILVEGCSFRWAGGRIGTHAFRVNPGVEDYTVELYCDRVELARALEQLGMTRAGGGGTANGRIPVRYSGGSLTFDNGYLYSTPGEKGVLHIQGTEILTAGVQPGTPQYGQLDLAAEALKDFAYEWAKIRLNTQQGELVVSLELDGKPEKPLPFTFNRDIGGFARVSGNSPGSVFQGIRLDVNFRLPLDQLLQYRQLLELMKNGG